MCNYRRASDVYSHIVKVSFQFYTVIMKKFVLAFLGLLGGLSLIAARSLPAETASFPVSIPVPVWSHDLIGPGGYLNDVEIDTAGDPHVLYVDASAAELRYARLVSGSWLIADLGPFPVDLPLSDLSVDLALDPTNDEPVVAYVDTERDNLYVGRLHGGMWWFDRVADGGRLVTLRLDASGGAHVAYVSGRDVYYYWRTNGAWHHETIGPPQDYVWNLFLALDSAGFPHVAGTGSGGSFYAQRLGSETWDMAVLPVNDLANIEGLALDREEQPHFLVTESEIMYGRPPFSRVTLSLVERAGGLWRFTPLWRDYDWYTEPRLVAGGDGDLHILYYDAQARPHYLVAQPGSFLVSERPFAEGIGQMSLSFGAADQPSITHFDGHSLYLTSRSTVMHDHAIFGLTALTPGE